jgi:hypothetical protein
MRTRPGDWKGEPAAQVDTARTRGRRRQEALKPLPPRQARIDQDEERGILASQWRTRGDGPKQRTSSWTALPGEVLAERSEVGLGAEEVMATVQHDDWVERELTFKK